MVYHGTSKTTSRKEFPSTMNLLQRIYCRVFQGVFRLALPILPYRDPKILTHVEDIPAALSAKGKVCPLIVTDGQINSLGLTKPLEKALTDRGMDFVLFDGARPNPTTAMVEKALELYRAHGCDSLIAFGGGSPMDCAKATGARVVRPRKSLGKMAGLLKVCRRLPYLIAVPTTAGTGSETTLAAVIVDAKTRHKYVINDFGLIPPCAVLDPQLIHSLPTHLMAATGMDALTHAVEAYIGRSTTKHTRADAEVATALVFANLKAAAVHESDAAEAAMLRAAHLAGRAFTRSYVGYVHAVSHSLSGMYDLPHGQTNATLLPLVLEMYGSKAHKKLARLAVVAGLGEGGQDTATLAGRFIAAVRELNDQLGIPRAIPNIMDSDIPTLAKYAAKEGNPLYPVPVLWNARELEEIYRKAGKQ